jgi:hypothetical protein
MKIPRTQLFLFTFVVATLAQITQASAADVSAVWDNFNGNWGDPFHWNTNPNYPNNTGGVTYDATINGGVITLDRNITIQRLFFNSSVNGIHGIYGSISGPFELTLNEGLIWTGGVIGSTTINLTTGSVSTITGLELGHYLGGTINNSGTVNQDAPLEFTGVINNLAGATWNMSGSGINPLQGHPPPNSGGIFNNAGNLVIGSVNGYSTTYLRSTFNNSGTVTLQSPVSNTWTLYLERGSASGSFNLGAQTILSIGPYQLTSGATINGPGMVLIDSFRSGELDIAGAVTINSALVNRGTFNVLNGAVLNLTGSFDQPQTPGAFSPPVTRLSGGTISSAQTLGFHYGILAGWGTINGNLSLSDRSILSLQLAGTSPGNGTNHYDSLTVNGATALGGNLVLSFAKNFENLIANSNTFTILTSSSGFTGSFDNAGSGSRVDTVDYFGTFLIAYGSHAVTLSNFVPNTRWLGGTGNWSDSTRWLSNPLFPNDTGSTHYSTLIRDGSVNLDTDITVTRFLMTGGTLTGGHSLSITGGLVWSGGTISGSPGSSVNLAAGSISTIAPPLDRFGGSGANITLSGTLNNFGTVTQSLQVNSGVINNMAGGTWKGLVGGSGIFNNFGEILEVNSNAGAVGFNNYGTVNLQGTSSFDAITGTSSGNFNVGPQASLRLGGIVGYMTTFMDGAAVYGTGQTTTYNLNVAGSATINTNVVNGGTLTVQSAGTLTLNGSFKQGSNSSSEFVTYLKGGTIASSQALNLERGQLIGRGTINGNVIVGSNAPGMSVKATVSPGDQFDGHGVFTINGNFSLLNSARVVMSLVGGVQAHNDALVISGSVMLDGTLELTTSLVAPGSGETFTLFSSSLLTGAFDNIANGARLQSANNNISFQVNYGAGSPYGANNVVLSDPQVVPEPASLLLFTGGGLALTLLRVRRR